MNETVAIVIAVITACGTCGAGVWGLFGRNNDEVRESDERGSDHTIEDIIHEITERNSNENTDTDIEIKINIHTIHNSKEKNDVRNNE